MDQVEKNQIIIELKSNFCFSFRPQIFSLGKYYSTEITKQVYTVLDIFFGPPRGTFFNQIHTSVHIFLAKSLKVSIYRAVDSLKRFRNMCPRSTHILSHPGCWWRMRICGSLLVVATAAADWLAIDKSAR